jgi:predicted AlkP superfamily pyrophosphatase or phosphodiesterase
MPLVRGDAPFVRGLEPLVQLQATVGAFRSQLSSVKRFVMVLAGVAASLTVAPRAQTPASGPDVRLVLLIVVDQFRQDYFARFRGEFASGLKLLVEKGAVFSDAHLEHYPTVTAVGHATMLSGAIPAVSGIIGNDWFDRDAGATVTSVFDTAVETIGGASKVGVSPHRLLVSTVGDELALSSGAAKGAVLAPRVIGLSLKDRSAILPVGRADAAYWFDARSGTFVTSTFYMKELPAWARAFNEKRVANGFAGKAWTSLASPTSVLKQLPDEVGPKLYDGVYASPFGNDLLLAFADEALVHERLGQRGVTDLLSISFSSNDAVGHASGPDSLQVRDISIRTDRVIGQLLERVDALVGLQHTLIAFTADHGVAPVPEALTARSLPAGRMTTKELVAPIEQALVARFGPGRWLLATAGSSPYLNYELIDERQIDPVEVRRVAAAAARTVPHVARVYTRDQLMSGNVPMDRIGRRVLYGFNAQRSGDLEIVLEPYWMRQAQGTTHGSPYNYDSHIPLILMGPRVRAGIYSDHVALNDLAPTISAVLDIEAPAGSSGRVLTEALLPPEPRPR